MNILINFKKLTESVVHKLIRQIFFYSTRTVFELPPIGSYSSQSQVALLTLLQEKDVQMYLMAAKSIMRYITITTVIVVCDQSLTENSKEIIRKHIKNIKFLDAKDYQNNLIPAGGCWERLYAISHLTNKYYIIQMDADILVTRLPEEVINSIELNNSFILGTNLEYQQLPIEKISSIVELWIEKWKSLNVTPHIQCIAEANMTRLLKPLGFKYYTRGCAGFAGYAKGSMQPDLVTTLSDVFYKDLGSLWNQWGTEQFTSNIILSNTNSVTVLPIEKYDSSDKYTDNLLLIHFIGAFRFNNFLYQKIAQKVINDILNTKKDQEK